jgi:hypothetical protein
MTIELPQISEQSFRRLQIGRIEALGEFLENRLQKRAGAVALSAIGHVAVTLV